MLYEINVNKKAINHMGEVTTTVFKDLDLREDHIESYLSENIDVICDGEETLLVVGRQVKDVENRRSDLLAVDANGSLVLIEIKRDKEDMKGRKEPLEFQAIRYAASYATIKDADELVDNIFSQYLERYKPNCRSGDLTYAEKARRDLNNFLQQNNATKTFNDKQRIILVASDFDTQVLSAVAWLNKNDVDISCVKLNPMLD